MQDLLLLNEIIFRPIFNLLVILLEVFQGYLGPAIIVLTLLIRSLMIKQTAAQQDMQQGMSDMQPKMQEIQEKYKDDPVKLQQEMMKTLKTSGKGPLKGCLMMVIQIPVFIGLFYVIKFMSDGGVNPGTMYSFLGNIGSNFFTETTLLNSVVSEYIIKATELVAQVNNQAVLESIGVILEKFSTDAKVLITEVNNQTILENIKVVFRGIGNEFNIGDKLNKGIVVYNQANINTKFLGMDLLKAGSDFDTMLNQNLYLGIFAGIFTFFQMKMTNLVKPAAATPKVGANGQAMPDMSKMMKSMGGIMALMIGYFVYSMQLGVGLYIATTSLFSTVQYAIIYRKLLKVKLQVFLAKNKKSGEPEIVEKI